MPDRPADLPEFDRPPVVEVAIGVQFQPIKGFRQAHIGLFWNQIRAEYPRTQDQPRLETPIDPPADAFVPSVQVELVGSPPVHRAWFVSSDDSLLVQVQDDRLIHNWRHRGGPYPRFEPLLERFWAHLDIYQSVAGEAGLSFPAVQQVEVTYINWIPSDSMEQFFRPSTAAEIHLRGIGPRPDSQHWAAWYPVHEGDELAGRLAVDSQPGYRLEESKPSTGFQLVLAFRAAVPPEASRARTDAIFAVGRNAIVRVFTEITTKPMHEEWGRQR